MPANVQTMAYYGQVPWHGLGKRVPKDVTADQMIRSAGLDWEVEVRAARGAQTINKKEEYSRYEIVRVPRLGTGEDEVLFGVVSRRYQALQNTEAFEFFDSVVSRGKAYFETAGALGEGERIWVMAKMPGAMTIVPGDECMKYLLLSNTHTGEGSVTVKFTTVRVVCQNTLMLAMEDGQKAYRVRHSKQMQFRLKDLSEFLAITQEIYLQAEALFKHMAKVQMNHDRLEKYFGAVFPRTEAQTKKRVVPSSWQSLYDIFESREDLQLPGVRGTLWGAYNAITGFEDHKPRKEDMAVQRFERTLFGGGADIKLKALLKAAELANSWN